MMDQLSFLVVHGGLLWKVALCAIAFGTPLVLWALERLRSRQYAQREQLRLGSPADSVASFVPAQVVSVKGRLRAHGAVSELAPNAAAATRYQRYVELQSEHAGGLQLDVQGQTVAIAGPVSVRVGSRYWPYRSFYSGLRQHTNALYSGDWVVARGRAQPRAAAMTTEGYRTTSSAWTLEPDGGSVALVGAGVPQTAAPTLGWHVSRGLIGGVVFLVALVVAGKLAYSFGSYTLAAATPLHRDAALKKLTPNDHHVLMTDREAERVGALLVLRGHCDSAVGLLNRTRRYRQAIEWAADCDHGWARDQAAEAAAQLVDYELSSDLYAANDSHHEQAVLVHIVARRWDRAHEALARMAAEYEATEAYTRAREYGTYSADQDRTLRQSAQEYDAGLDCLVQGVAVRAGDPEALERLRKLVPSGGEMCTLVFAELLPRTERLAYLARHPQPDNSVYSSFGTVRDVLAENSESRSEMDRSIVPDPMRPADVLALPLAERSMATLDASDTSLEARWRRARVALRVAGAAAIAHQWERAVALLESSMAEFTYKSPYTDRHQAALAMVRFRRGDIAGARAVSEQVESMVPTVTMLIALHDRNLSAFEPRSELAWRYDEWLTAIKRALAGDTAGLRGRVLEGAPERAPYDISRFAHAAALFGPLLPQEDQRHLAEQLAHRSNIVFARPDSMFATDSLIEFAAHRLGATELAAVYRDRLARRYEVLRNPAHGAFLMLVARL